MKCHLVVTYASVMFVVFNQSPFDCFMSSCLSKLNMILYICTILWLLVHF